jgi:Fe-S-cluster containining protein
MRCRERCGACCIAPSINEPVPGMPDGKPAGVRCIHLTRQLRCSLFHSPERPAACAGFLPERTVCGWNREQALVRLHWLESTTA